MRNTTHEQNKNIFFTGGILGIGTLVTAFGLGPVIHFFDRTVTRKYIIKSRE